MSASDDHFAFERRAPRERGPFPTALVLSLVLLGLVGGGVLWMYRSGLRAPGAPPQPLGAPIHDVKTMAPPEAARPDPAAGLSIYKDDPNAPAAPPAYVNPPEQPGARPKAPQTIDQILANPPAAPQPAGPSDGLASATKPAVAKTEPGPVKAAARIAKETKTPAKATGIGAKPTALAQHGDAAAPASTGGFTIQIGAFKDPSAVHKGLDEAMAAAGALARGKPRHVTPLTKDDGSRLYRGTISGFATKEAAVAACAKIRAAGKTCLLR